MKIILLSLILLCSAITSNAQTVITQKTPNKTAAKPKAPEHLYLKVHFTPIIVIATLAECNFDEETNKLKGKISIKTVLKGDAENKKMLDVNFKWGYELKRLPVGETPKPSYEKGKTYVFFYTKITIKNGKSAIFI